ncbi:hypothetical protein ACFP81_14055 [Deinococcus lacus]|uniref:Tetratricopeptide repeat protein n=1 Tax=Deinococcus lacus TaxID=392561 RepID=A0ABW1YFY8_9DEIO
MTTDPYELIEQAYKTGDHAEAFALWQEAVRQADLQGDEEAGYEARDGLLDAAQEATDGVTMLTTFSWMLNYADTHPEEDKEDDLFWRYKWAIAVARFMPKVPLERLHALQDDFERRTVAAGLGRRTADVYRWSLALHRGDLETAEQLRQSVSKQKSGWLDCNACDTDLLVQHWLAQGELEKALKAAKPILDGKRSCNRIPARTYTHFLRPLLDAGRAEEAQDMHLKGYKMVRRDEDSLREQSAHLAYLILSGQEKDAQKVFKATLPFAEKNTTPLAHLAWHSACALDEKITGEGHAQKARELAAAFDKRGGTGHQTEQVETLLAKAAARGEA